MTEAPNVLWIQTDEQRPDSLSCYGPQGSASSWARTPALAGLAARGTVFQNAVCQSPVCVPSRASQLAARYPHEIGVLNNWATSSTFPEGTVTFPEVFARAGYETVSFGKRHTPEHAVWQGGTTCGLLRDSAGFCALAEDYDEEAHHVVTRPGTPPLIVAGTYPEGQSNQSRVITDQAIAYLRDRGPGGAGGAPPFLLRVSHLWPHTPVLAPAPFDDLYDPDALPIRVFDEQAYRSRSRYDRTLACRDGMQGLSEDEVRQVWTDYMGLCAYVDHEVGRLLAALDDLGLRGDTIVVYSADHGKMLGAWGAGEKDAFDAEVWRVPFIWSWPGHIPEGVRVQAPCELIDTARTLLGLTGLEDAIPDGYRGRNLFADDPPGAVFGATRPEWYFPRDAQAMRVAVRTDRFRMDVTWSVDGSRPPLNAMDGNLFDLADDPYETENRWDDAGYRDVRTALIDRLAAWLEEAETDPRLLDPETAAAIWHPSPQALAGMKRQGLDIKVAGVDGWPPDDLDAGRLPA